MPYEKSNIQIISDGTPEGTRVYTEKGERLKGVQKIEFSDIEPGGELAVRISILQPELNITCVGDQYQRSVKLEVNSDV